MPSSAAAFRLLEAYVQGWTVLEQCRSYCRGKRDSFYWWLNKSIYPQRTQKTLNCCCAKTPKCSLLVGFTVRGAAEWQVSFHMPVGRKRPLTSHSSLLWEVPWGRIVCDIKARLFCTNGFTRQPAGEITPAQWMPIAVVSSREPPYLASFASFADNKSTLATSHAVKAKWSR